MTDMKARGLVWIGLILQCGFILFTLFSAAEPVGLMKVGLQKLQSAYPTEAPTRPEANAGSIVLKTLGDWFSAASGGFEFLTRATLLFAGIYILLLLGVLGLLRSKKSIPNPDVSRVN
jgi:hypothetical protein